MPDPSSANDAADLERFAALLQEAVPVLLAWAHCRLRGPLRQRLDVEDLVQEIGMRACLRRADYDPARGTFVQWLLGFANRVWLETLRALGRDPCGPMQRRGGDSVVQDVLDTVTTVTRRAARGEAASACRDRIDQLDEQDRMLLLAIGIENLGHAEASAMLGIGEDACRKRWQRLRATLQGDPVLRQFAAERG
ncbi:MAG: sigma-70 family RNA polymerase sigma factor [Planctomycetes bacterium]|nr:sigma-70 family RNA polymerase sigma factor [Planctomycetota bacterium]